MKRIALFLFLTLPLAACQSTGSTRPSAATPVAAQMSLAGQFDNHEQVWSTRENAAAVASPHVIITVEPTPQADWSLWRIRLDATPALEAVWAMHRTNDGTLVPHRALLTNPESGSGFDARQWTPLDACSLRGVVAANGIRVAADSSACAAVVPGIGPAAALLPLAIERDGEWLRLRLYADQARGAEARTDARQVTVFGGWAALNGAGPSAAVDGKDWHMDRALRLGSEGGRVALKWRDGRASGYSLGLERLTYRDGNVPVLKLSVIDDRSGSTLAYAWANPEASRIGLSLGWVQVGLERESAALH